MKTLIIRNLSEATFEKLKEFKKRSGFNDKDWSEFFDFLVRDIRLQELVPEKVSRYSFEVLLPLWAENFGINLPFIRGGKAINDLEGIGKGKAAIVVGAGPSLYEHKHLEMLAKSDFDGFVLVCDRVLKDALHAGVTPDKFPLYFVGTVDANRELIWKHYDDPLVEKFGSKIKGLFTSMAAPNAREKAEKAGIEIYWYNPHYDDWRKNESFTRLSGMMTKTESRPKGIGCIKCGGNVGSALWVISFSVLNCSPTALIGIDLGYLDETPIEKTAYYEKILKSVNGNVNLASQYFRRIYNPYFKCYCLVDYVFDSYRKIWLDLASKVPKEYVTVNCLPKGSLVLSNLGWKKVEEVKVGDLLLTHKGRYKPVTKIFQRHYDGNIIEITCRGKFHLSLTPEHPVLIVKGRKDKFERNKIKRDKLHLLPKVWERAENIKKGDFIVFPIPNEVKDIERLDLVNRRRIETYFKALDLREKGLTYREIATKLGIEKHQAQRWTNKKSPRKIWELDRYKGRLLDIKLDNDFMRLIGYYLAEGTVGKWKGIPHRPIWTFNTNEKQFINDVIQILREKFELKPRVKKISNSTHIYVCSKPLGKFLAQFGVKAPNKKIPEWVMNLPPSKQAELIKGYWRGDGNRTEYGFRFSSSSKDLLQQIRLILMRLKVLSSLYANKQRRRTIRGRRIKEGQSYSLDVYGEGAIRLANLLEVKHPIVAKKRLRWSTIINGLAYIEVEKVTKTTFKGKVYNFEVKDDESYVTEIGAVHNCTEGGCLFGEPYINCMKFEDFLTYYRETTLERFFLKAK